MKRWFTTFAAVMLCSAALRADVTIVMATTMEGGMMTMAAQAGQNLSPKMTTRIKGLKQRSDIETGPMNVVTILDLAEKQLIVLNVGQKTATVKSLGAASAAPATTMTTTTTTATTTMTGPTIDGSMKPTGRTQTIDGVKTEEFTFTTNLDMSSMGGGQMPPEAAAAMQGVKMNMAGSIWVAKDVPGASEYMAFQKAAAGSDLLQAAMGATGMNIPGMDKMMKAMSAASGMAYLTEMTMTIEGTGQIAEMMKQMGPMKITQKVSSINADPIADDQFKIPAGYTINKQ
jgi:hypothetical protein